MIARRRVKRPPREVGAALYLLAVYAGLAITLFLPDSIDDPDVARHVVLALSCATLAAALLGIALATRWLKQWLLLRSGRCIRCGFVLDDPTSAPTETLCTDCGCPAGGPLRRSLQHGLRRRACLAGFGVFNATIPTFFWAVLHAMLSTSVLTPELRTHLTINLAVAAAIAVLIIALNNPREILANLIRRNHRP